MLAPDTLLGPYRIVSPIGAGGMGEVYRATDTRLGREVAVKVLSSHLTNDGDATRRFEQEARAAGMLNHPNVLAIYDIGTEGDVRYIVSELLEGESLRARIRSGPIPARKATDYAQQIARGLAAAHERGIIHRDLKPENVFITRDGIVKILDFGLVKLMQPLFRDRTPGDENAPTLQASPTEPGRVLGTVGYMAPEQIRGGSGDHRSDIFSFGAILYEMLAGRPAFQADSPVETLNAILKDEPPELDDLGVRAPDALERIVHHCLEKNPDERFQSARDLAFHLGTMSGLTSRAIPTYRLTSTDRRRLLVGGPVVLAALLMLWGAFYAGSQHGRRAPSVYQRVSYRSGTILAARFATDDQTVFYGERMSGNDVAVYSVRGDSPESRDLGFGNADLLSVSSTGQLAILLRPRFVGYLRQSGTLAQVAIAGGAPRQILDDVEAADWAPDGSGLAIVRTVQGRCRLEYPIGKVLYTTTGWISTPRFSRDGRSIAFADHPFPNDDRGSIGVVIVADASHRALTPDYESVQGVAWSPGGDEIWYGADESAHGRAVNAVTLRGKTRTLQTSPGWVWLSDVSHDGRILLTRQSMRAGILASVAGETRERELSWLDYSVVRDLSSDGRTILFSESGEAGGPLFGVYIRDISGTPAIRLGEGTSEALSPDGKWVLSIPRKRKTAQIMMLPTGPGQPRQVTNDALSHRSARWFPDGQRILFQAAAPGRGPQLWVQSITGGAPRAISPENVVGTVIARDGRNVLGRDGNTYFYFPVDGGAPVPIRQLHPPEVPVRFTPDGHSLYVATFGRIPALLTKVNLDTGERTLTREAAPADRSGLINVGPIFVTPDASTTVYSYTRLLSELYVTKPL